MIYRQQDPGAPKILIVLHQEHSTPGRCGLMLQDMGYQLEACRPCIGDNLPDTLEGLRRSRGLWRPDECQ